MSNETTLTTDLTEEGTSMSAFTNRGQIINRLQEFVQDISLASKSELDYMKQCFYKMLHSEQEAIKNEIIAAGGSIEEYTPKADELENQYKSLCRIIKEKRNAQQEALEVIRQNNLKRKNELLEQFQALIERTSTDGVPYNEIKAIQKEWKEIKDIPANKATELWKRYQQYSERFYDIQKLNNEFREYDFKKNLEAKIAICEEAEQLIDSKDIIAAARRLQKLHNEFREIGPVAKELRNEIWERFKSASTVINRKHQQHFESIKKREQEHYDQKVAICEILESIDYTSLKKFQDWNRKTQEVQAIQQKWRDIGFAPQKQNKRVYERYKEACNNFFELKSQFFKQAKNEMSDNIAKKVALCEEVERLCSPEDWGVASKRVAEIQREWREIGPVQKRHFNPVWDRFAETCNQFYRERDKHAKGFKSEEHENLFRKRSILNKLRSYNPSSLQESDTEKIQLLIDEWNSIGYVPYRVKEKLSDEFNDVFSQLESVVKIQKSRKESHDRVLKDGAQNSKERLTRQYEALINEIKTYETNLASISLSSKNGNLFIESIQDKIKALKSDAQKIRNKIAELDK